MLARAWYEEGIFEQEENIFSPHSYDDDTNNDDANDHENNNIHVCFIAHM